MKRLLSCLFALLVLGCGDNNGSDQASEATSLEAGFELVAQNRFEDAIRYFENMYLSKPTDDALKAWASVYVSRAGIKISSLYIAFSTFPAPTEITKDNLLPSIKSYQQSLESIPYVKNEARDDLETASAILKSRKSASVRLFRAVVNLILLRSTFSDGNAKLKNAKFKVDLDENLKVVCKLDWKNLKTWLQDWTYFGLEMKQDLDLAFPKKVKDWNQGGRFFSDAREMSTTLTTVCGP